MKTIGKKIKAIYFLAVIAIVSMCMAILPLMSTNVKADTQDVGLNVVGAQVIVIDETTTTQNFDGKYSVSFQAEFTKELYEKLNVRGNTVKFGMLVGPAANYEAVTSVETAAANGYVNSCFLGNKDCAQYISFELGETTCKYEASIEYKEEDIVAGLETDAEKLNAVLTQSSQKLTAIPYYVVNGNVMLVKVDNPITRSARELINDEYAFSNKVEFGDELFARYVGTFDAEYSGCEYYVEKSTGKVFKSNANNELVPFYAVDFVEDGQLLVDAKDVEADALAHLTLAEQTVASLAEGQEYSIAAFIDDESNTVRTIKAKVVTKIISKIEDFFNDVDGDGLGDVTRDNYIFKLENIPNSYDGNSTTSTIIEGYYVLGANIDLADNANLITAYGDKRFMLNSPRGGFMATLDGRGFAISNINVANSSSGMLGLLNNATIKNIAFDGFLTSRNDSTPSFLAHNTYNSTFENVYISAKSYVGNFGDNYVSSPRVFGAISDKYGESSFTNVIFDNTQALVEGNTSKYNRAMFTNDVTSNYTNTSVIGLPANYTQTAHETDTEKRVLTLYVSSAAMDKFGVEAGEYALADCPTAVTTAYAGLIKNIEDKFSVSIGYITFVEDTVRNYYVDNAGLVADTTAKDAYLATGMWTTLGGKLVWKSLFDEAFTVASNNEDPTNMTFTDSITLEMFKGDEKIEDVRIRVRGEDADFITASGNTITKRPEAALIKTRPITVDVVYTVGAKSYEVAVDLLLELDYSKLNVYQSGEFIIETSTGKVYAPNANNELVDFDATGYLADSTKLYFAGIEMETVSVNPFTINVAALEGLTLGEKQPIVAICDGEARYLLASTASKVLFSANDFFVDADGSGEVEDAERIQANYIFHLGTDTSGGLIRPQKTIKGYYVLANNINLSGVAIGNGDTGERHYQIADATGNLGFNGTFDGRGFALQNGNPSRTTGMFGMFYGATVKNIAFDGFTNSVGNSNALILGRAYNSTFENIYFRITGNNGNDRYAGAGNTFTTITSADNLGVSNFNNIVFESMDGLTAGNTNRHQRQTLISNATWGSFTNTSVIGMPVTFAYAKHATDTEKAVLTLTLPAATLSAFDVEAGEYAIADCQAAVTAFAGLIANIEEKQASQIGYIKFVEDVNARNYYSDGASLAADTEVANAYIESGYWTKLGNALTWKSLVNVENFVVKSNNADPENLMFQDSISLEMYAGSTLLEGIEITTAQENLELIDIDGAIITKKDGVVLVKDEIIALTLTYSDGINSYSKQVEVTLQADLSLIVEYESGEFVFDKTTGELLKANANNELVPYDATGFTADVTEIYVAGVETTIKNVTEFTVDASELANLAVNEEIAITAIYNDGTEVGARCLKVKAATRVLSELRDFFVDANADGTIADDEMTRANFIFNLQAVGSSGAAIPSIAIKGHYVLANNIDLKNNSALCNRGSTSGDHTLQIWNGSSDVGFRGTLDGRGFALKNGSPSGSSAGMFGAFYGATVKNIAFDGFTNAAGNGSGLVLGYAYRSTFENVYIRLVGNNNGDTYASEGGWNAFTIADTHGASTFTNLVVESMDGLAEGKTNIHQRFAFTGNATTGMFTNTTIIGMPVTYKCAASTTDASKKALQVTISQDAMTALGVTAGEIQLSALPEAASNVYANLIANIEARAKVTGIDYINFIEDTKGRAYYTDNAAFSANADAVASYVATGCWTQLGDIIAWKSLVDSEYFTVKSNNEDPANMMFKDSIALDMYYGTTKLEGVEITTAQENLEFIAIDGTTVSKKAGALLIMDKLIEVTLTYSDGANSFSKNVQITLQANLDEIDEYESGEFIVDKATGKVLKSNANNELVPYDATAFMANVTEVYVAGVEATAVDTTAFTLNAESVANLPVNEELAITVVYDDGTVDARCLKVKAATKVFSTYADFFNDADGSGVVEDAEMVFANNFFNQKISSNKATVKTTGYYVLANNIAVGKTSALSAGSGNSAKPNNTNEDFGFQGTFDGRGFALSGTFVLNNGSGLFGLVKNATIKNAAFIGLANQGDDAGNPTFARYIYDSTLENVYITIAEYSIGWNQKYRTTANAITGISNTTLTNVIFENNAWKSNTTSIQKSENSWQGFGTASTTATYTNVNVVGVPITVGYKVHVAATDTETAKYKLIFTLPLATIQKYVAAPGVYALADCGGAETDFAKLIAGIKAGETSGTASLADMDIQYIEFVEETSTRGYFYDYAALSLDETVANAYAATGCWTKIGNELVWTTLVDESKISVKVNPEDGKFTDSATIETYYGEELVNAKLSVSEADAKYVEISGNVVSKKAGAQVLADKTITVTVTYLSTVETVELTLVYDPENIILYDESEFVIDRATGKVLKANENSQLVEYDATSYLASANTVMVGEAQQTVANASAFTLDKTGFETLKDGSDYLIVSGENVLSAKVVTKVLSTVKDFFNDANSDGTVADDEMIQANYIFNLQVVAGSGARNPQVAIKGYYVLANNIDLGGKTALVASGLGDQTVQIFNGSADVGFRGTLDGRGFALKNGNPGGSSGGMFGAFYGATIKNIAFDGFQNTRNDGGVVILGYTYNSKFENVYIRVVGNEYGDTYLSSNGGLTVFGVVDNHGASSFTNVVFESTVGLEAGKTNDHYRVIFTGHAAGNFENTTIIGMPVTFKYAKHTTDTEKYVLSLTFPADVLTSFGVEAKEYALSALPEAVTSAYGDLIANLESKAAIDIEYVNFIADRDGRAYYLNNTALSANADLVATYVETGCWKVVEGKLVWDSL